MSARAPIRLFHPHGPDRVAVVSLEPASVQGTFFVRVARGAKLGKLSGGTAYGPFPEAEAGLRFDDAIAALRAEGFGEVGHHALLVALQDKRAKVRARAALRLGWNRDRSAVDALLAAAPGATGDICSIADALGWIGDERAVALARELAARKLLSRRRSGVEALRNLGDADGLAEARQHALARLPAALREALAAIDESSVDAKAVEPLSQALAGVSMKDKGLVLDTLYEIGTRAPVAAVHSALSTLDLGKPYLWRYAKSISKRASLRHDYETFGIVSHRIEALGRSSKGTTATVKSGLDGKDRATHIFGRGTQAYMRRAAWRFLRKLAKHRPEAYPYAAADAIVSYGPADAGEPKGFFGSFAGCYVLHQVVWGASSRFVLRGRSMRFRYKSAQHAKLAPGPREHAFAELWDREPRAFLRVLSAARLPEVHAFAARAVQSAHLAVMREATADQLTGMLRAPYEATVSLGLAELDRRFDATKPDWSLLEKLAGSETEIAAKVGQRWVRDTASLWTKDIERTLSLLAAPNAATRSLVAELTVRGLEGAAASYRRALAERILAVVRAPEPSADYHTSFARVGREALAADLAALVSVPELLAILNEGSMSAKALAGSLLAHRPDAVGELGLPRVLALAQHEIAAVRTAAHALLRGAVPMLRDDPSLLFMLVESEWPDTREAAFAILRTEIDLARLGLDGLVSLCDSNRVDVQNVGRDLLLAHFNELEPHDVLYRLSQHPHPNMRRFALELVEQHLKDGFIPLAKLEGFFRAALLDLWPEADVKRRVVEFLAMRGVRDERQAEVASTVLRDVLRTKTRVDFERIAEALVRIKLAHPEVDVGLTVEVAS